MKAKMQYNVRIAGFDPFYYTDNLPLAVKMTQMLLDAGYIRATLMGPNSLLPIWPENFEVEVKSWNKEKLAKAFGVSVSEIE